MLPVLLSLGPIKIYSYGFFIAIAFLVATFFIWKFSREEEFEEEKILDGILFGTFAGFFGARLLYIILHIGKFTPNLIRTVHIFKFPGLIFHGGLVFGTIFLFFYFRNNKIPFFKIGDIFVLGLLLAQGIVDFGCFLNGCFIGVKTNLPWGVYFPGFLGKRHPVQIYELFFVFLLFYFLFRIYKKILPFKEKERGLILICYFILFNFERFLLEFLREDSVYWRGTKIIQVISGGIGVFAVFIFLFKYRIEIKEWLKNQLEKIKSKKQLINK